MTDATAAADDRVTVEVTSIEFTECELLALDAIVRTEEAQIPLGLFGLSGWAEDPEVLAAATRNGFSQMAIFGKVRLEEGNIVLSEDLGTLGTFMAQASRWIGVSLVREGQAKTQSIRWMSALEPGLASVGLEELNFATWMIEPLPLPAETTHALEWILGRAQKVAQPGDTLGIGVIDPALADEDASVLFDVTERGFTVRDGDASAGQSINWTNSPAAAVIRLLESRATTA